MMLVYLLIIPSLALSYYYYSTNKTMNTIRKVFVYGTLKRNEPNHNWITNSSNGTAKFVGIAKTISKFPLVIGSRYNIPFLLDQEGTGYEIEGEVYEVDETMLEHLDILESHPRCYERRVQQVLIESSTHPLNVWIYLLTNFKQKMMELPLLTSYSSNDDHGLKYVSRQQRQDAVDYCIDVKDKN